MAQVEHIDTMELTELRSTSDEHPSMECIREALRQYQLQSPDHFEIELEVHQLSGSANHSHEEKSTETIETVFQGHSRSGYLSIPASCCIVLRRCHSEGKPWMCIGVARDQTLEALEHFLSSKFPTFDAPLQQDALWRWWGANGKTFNWTGLPTELKEHIVEFCMHQPHQHGIYSERLARYGRRYKPNHKAKKIGPLEIVDQLGEWYQLLYVSHQMRAITLRLCITGGSGLTRSKGLCVASSSYKSFFESINRLGDYYQMIQPESVPTTSKEEVLSKCYRRFPRIYPNLKQYATLRHGIQKISLGMDFLSFMQFFRVKAGGFQRYQKARGLTYHIFERLPKLNEIVISLPLRPRGGWKNAMHPGGLRLFHEDAPCPRSLHRLIYERIAEALASYNVSVRNLIDEEEMQRFASARLEAIKAQKFTEIELEDLYADDEGGIELPHDTERGSGMPGTKWEKLEAEHTEDLDEEYFPVFCHCEEPCASSPTLWAPGNH